MASYLEECPILKSEFKELPEKQFSLLTRKDAFPYDFMGGWDKLKEQKLWLKQAFYNSPDDARVGSKSYEHASVLSTLDDFQEKSLVGPYLMF